MDIQSDIVLVASQFSRENTIHRDVVLPVYLDVYVYFPESISNIKVYFLKQ